MKRYVLVGTGMRGTLSYMVPMIKDLSEVNDAPSVIQTLMKHARIQAAQAEKDHNREPQQKSLEAVLS